MEAVPSHLKSLAEAGDSDAQIAMGNLSDRQGQVGMARAWFARAAKAGNAAALRLLATHLLTRQPVAEADGVNIARLAAERGDAEAMHLCAMLAAQSEKLRDRWQTAIECLQRAADAGHALAASELEFCSREDIHALLDVTNLVRHTVAEAPRIVTIESFVPAETCRWLIARASPRLTRAQVYDPGTGGGRYEHARTNSAVEFNIADSDLVLLLIRQRIAALLDVPCRNLEVTTVLHYSVGENFEEHFDFLDPAVPAYARDIADRGQRMATFLLYLNEEYTSGETTFPTLEWSYKGKTGDALLFWNLTPSGAPEPRSRHSGTPPSGGEKWLLSQWIRERTL